MTTITLEVPDELAIRLHPLRKRLTDFLTSLVKDSFHAPPSSHPADEMLNFLISRPAPADILLFKSSPEAQARLEELLDKNREESLNETEQLELDKYLQMNNFFILLKAHARSFLMSKN